jgi:hypothetical protein
MIDAIDVTLNDNFFLPPQSVRLIFHDCISGCNGCINIQNSDNARLRAALTNNVVLYETGGYGNILFYGKYYISRADFWVLVAMRSLYISNIALAGLTLPILDFKVGRVNCANGATLDDIEDLPKSHRSWDHMVEMFGPGKFNFTTREIVALMGVHALGQSTGQTCGYHGWWTVRNRIFDNSYYKQMIDTTMKYENVPLNITGFGLKYQWNATSDWCIGSNCVPRPARIPRIMLNPDMSLHLKFNVDSFGKADCTYATCSKNDAPSVIVQEFANSEVAFKQAFGPVFSKMVEHGYEGKCILRDPVTGAC